MTSSSVFLSSSMSSSLSSSLACNTFDHVTFPFKLFTVNGKFSKKWTWAIFFFAHITQTNSQCSWKWGISTEQNNFKTAGTFLWWIEFLLFWCFSVIPIHVALFLSLHRTCLLKFWIQEILQHCLYFGKPPLSTSYLISVHDSANMFHFTFLCLTLLHTHTIFSLYWSAIFCIEEKYLADFYWEARLFILSYYIFINRNSRYFSKHLIDHTVNKVLVMLQVVRNAFMVTFSSIHI